MTIALAVHFTVAVMLGLAHFIATLWSNAEKRVVSDGIALMALAATVASFTLPIHVYELFRLAQ